MTDLQTAFNEGFEAVKGYVDRSLTSLHKRIDELEKGTMRYAGVWQRATEYKKGSLVTSDGSAWVALKAVEPGGEKPNGGPWQLVFKSGIPK